MTIHDAQAKAFRKRQHGSVIAVGNYAPGDVVGRKGLADATDAVLHTRDGTRVLVRSIKSVGSKEFTAEIYGFDPSHGTEHEGMRIGDMIRFNELHGFSCSV